MSNPKAQEVTPQDAVNLDELVMCFDEMLVTLRRAAGLACASKHTEKNEIARFAEVINRAESLRSKL